MKKIAIATDSNSGITQEEGGRREVFVLPMPFLMDGTEFFEDVSLTQEAFYERLLAGAEISTSQPAPGAVIEFWDQLLQTHDQVIHIPMSSGLSASCASAIGLSAEYEGRVFVVDNRRISVTQRQSALDAQALAAAGKDGAEIKAILEKEGPHSQIYIMVDTLKYLKKGGRITPAAAAIGTVLNLKPILKVNGGKLDAFAKVRGSKQGKKQMIEVIKNDLKTTFAGEDMWLQAAYTYDKAAADEFLAEVESAIPGYNIICNPLSLSVSCHIGPGALGIACSKKVNINAYS